MSQLSTFYKPAITAADLNLGTSDNVTFGSIQNTPIGSTTPAAGTFTTLTANNGTLTASAPVLDLAQTWNSSGTTFTGLRLNVTNTASGVLSNLVALQVGGTDRVRVRNDGFVTIDPSGTNNAVAASTSTLMSIFGVVTRSSGQYSWTSGINYTDTVDLILARDGAAGTLAQRNGTNAQTFNIYNTFTSATNHERGFLKWSSNVFQIGTEAGSGGGTNREAQILAGSSTYRFGTNNVATFPGPLTLGQTSGLFWFGRGRIQANADGVFSMEVNAGGDFNRLQFGGTTSSFPALKRNNAELQVRLADDSALTAIGCSTLRADSIRGISTWIEISDSSSGPRFAFYSHGGMLLRDSGYFGWHSGASLTSSSTGDVRLFRDAAATLALRDSTNSQTFRIYNTVSGTGNVNFDRVNFRWSSNEFIIDAEAGGTGTLRGIKIGSATSSLLGFYGATPVDRPATVTDPTGGGTIDTEARTAINDIIDRLQELGLIA